MLPHEGDAPRITREDAYLTLISGLPDITPTRKEQIAALIAYNCPRKKRNKALLVFNLLKTNLTHLWRTKPSTKKWSWT